MNIQQLFAERIGGAVFGLGDQIYKFEKIKRAKIAARKEHQGVELLDFGVGEPDQIAPGPIRRAMKKAIDDPANRGYADNGIREFKVAAASYMKNFFCVSDLDPDREINHSIGSKPVLAILPLCFVNPGDVVLVTVPGYPVLATHAKYMGGQVVKIPLRAENDFLPDLEKIDADTAKRAKLFYVNYPNNPTGAVATEVFFDRLIAFAQANNIIIVQDAAYATLVYKQNKQKPLSILSRPGGKEVAVELHSMSKSYNMTGWRLGFVAGSAQVVKAYAEVKDNIDSGQFKAIQIAACAGIADVKLSAKITRHYERRLKKMVKCLRAAGFEAKMPGGTFYLYVSAPKGAGAVDFNSAEDAADYLLRNHLVSTVPWDDVSSFLRFSATFESAGPKDDDRVLGELQARLLQAGLRF